jgi:hypothetical protein
VAEDHRGMSRADAIEKLGKYVPIRSGRDRKFPYVRSPLYGVMPAPQTLSKLFQYLEDTSAMSIWDCWRGQANIAWRLDSTAARRMLLHDTDIRDIIYEGSFEGRVRNYESRLLNQARMAGHDIHGGRELSDLELLSVLRHYGAATRLMDFSRSILVAPRLQHRLPALRHRRLRHPSAQGAPEHARGRNFAPAVRRTATRRL